ncbi:MAG: hypothetical protein ABI643_03705 [Candidatus Doudnabacteria bacterium]
MPDEARQVMTGIVCEIVASYYGIPKEEVTADFELRLPLVYLGPHLVTVTAMPLKFSIGMKISSLVDQILNPPTILTDEDFPQQV